MCVCTVLKCGSPSNISASERGSQKCQRCDCVIQVTAQIVRFTLPPAEAARCSNASGAQDLAATQLEHGIHLWNDG